VMKKLSRIGFGTYRLYSYPRHKQALVQAIKRGINVIDTSSNYGGGESETTIGQELNTLITNKEIHRQNLFLISKFGYVQGTTLEAHNAKTKEIKDIIPAHAPYALHSIHPEFMRDELEKSLNRLQTNYLDLYLLHNPEYYLMHHLAEKADKASIADHRQILLSRLEKTFAALENEVDKGKILAYGVSSNTVGFPEDAPHYFPFKDLLPVAQKAAHSKGKAQHKFEAIQFPANLLETEALGPCGLWAHQKGLKVIVNRPLNAFNKEGEWRLASVQPPTDYEQAYLKALDLLKDNNNDANKQHLSSLIKQLHTEANKFQSILHYEDELGQSVMPSLVEKLNAINNDGLTLAMQEFLAKYEQRVRNICANRTEHYIEQKNIGFDKGKETLQQFSLQYLLSQKHVSCVLNGMVQLDYVNTAVDLLKQETQ